jgi:hypothetical protein
MEEQRRPYRTLLALVGLPLALVIVVPVVVLLGLSFYLRVAFLALVYCVRYLLGHKAAPADVTSVQPPHCLELPVHAAKLRE